MNLEQLTDAVWKRLYEGRPKALLIGEVPPGVEQYSFVKEEPYEAIVLGILSPGELLHMPTDPVCRALLADIPVYLWPDQLHHKAKTAKVLCRELSAAEQHLRQLGVRLLGKEQKLITAQTARQYLQLGYLPEPGSRMTPLARDILEGKEI